MDPALDAAAYQIGTPHVLSLAPVIGALELFEEVGIEKIREKSLQLTDYMMTLIQQELSDYGFTIGNPVDDIARGPYLAWSTKKRHVFAKR